MDAYAAEKTGLITSLASCEYSDLQAIGLSRRKSEYIIDLARLVTSGEIDFDALHAADADIQGQADYGEGDW